MMANMTLVSGARSYRLWSGIGWDGWVRLISSLIIGFLVRLLVGPLMISITVGLLGLARCISWTVALFIMVCGCLLVSVWASSGMKLLVLNILKTSCLVVIGAWLCRIRCVVGPISRICLWLLIIFIGMLRLSSIVSRLLCLSCSLLRVVDSLLRNCVLVLVRCRVRAPTVCLAVDWLGSWRLGPMLVTTRIVVVACRLWCRLACYAF